LPQQHTENLFRRYKGQVVIIRSVSGEEYKGHVGEITNDYVVLVDRDTQRETETFVFFNAIETIVVPETPA
jgi:hypothetical protein